MNEIVNWQDVIRFPLGERTKKPRASGLTIVIDKGMGLGETKDLLKIGGEYIDFVKLGFGTPALYDPWLLREKIELVRAHNIDIYPGGTFLEVAILQEKLEEFLLTTRNFGFTAIEISDGTINLSGEVRAHAISMAVNLGFKVLTEVGKKHTEQPLILDKLIEQIHADLRQGACWVIVEGRECGMSVGLYDARGEILEGSLHYLLKGIDDHNLVIWEAPLKSQQQDLIRRFGPNVNLGNIPPHEVLAVEALRVGLRADTLALVQS